jgi:hypothetical protein
LKTTVRGHPLFFVCVAGKELAGGDFVCVAGKGVARGVPCSVDPERPSKRAPHPGCFAKRVRKLLKIKERSTEKSDKRLQECASY